MEHNIDCEEDPLICQYAELIEQLGKNTQKKRLAIFDIFEFICQNSISGEIPFKIHIVGSSAEGVTALDIFTLETDIDLMCDCSWFQAYERREILGNKDQMIFRMDSEGAVPGYAYLKLQIFDETTNTTYEESLPSTDILLLGSTLFNIDLPIQNMFSLFGAPCISNGYLNGPSLAMGILTQGNFLTSSFPTFIKSFDRVFAIKCNEWPMIADEWMERERHFSWPSGEIIAKAIELGCYLVPIGKDDKFEWRISFVLAEKLLVRNMNPMQTFVYSFLKSIKEEIFSPVTSGITSYILKTVLFWVSEENDVANWRPWTVLQHVRLCFLKLTEFLCFGKCPHYFMKSCDLFYRKMSHVEIVELIAKLTNMTNSMNFKLAIINLKSIKLLSKNAFLPIMPMLKNWMETMPQLNGKVMSRFCDELSQNCVETLFNNVDVQRPEQIMVIIANVLRKVKRYDNDLSVSFKDTLIRILSCLQIRATCAYEFQTLTGPNSAKTIDDNFQLVSHLIKQSKLQVETLCPGDLTQIAHTFFSVGCFENCLKIISTMLEMLKTKFQTKIGSVMSLCQVYMSLMFGESDASFASPARPLTQIEFFPFEVEMLTKDLKLEIVTLEMQNENLRNSFPVPFLFSKVRARLQVNPLVYAFYLKFQCCRFLVDNQGSWSVLRDFEESASSGIFQNAISFNLLGCCLKENGHFEKGIQMFGRSIQKNKELLGTKYQTAILLKHAFNS
ncbi:uncharacterized protein LOC134280691 [Saccostrea cucullata]|uniref:uncharacterized protein LOC134280691 n=1 Tax=Saccostrea cuccullata TaxID=36930 RepID=UPI002ED09519